MAVICKKCGLPDDLCPCGELEKEETRIIIRLETRRFSKTTTMIEGIDPKVTNMHNIVKELKSQFTMVTHLDSWNSFFYYISERLSS